MKRIALLLVLSMVLVGCADAVIPFGAPEPVFLPNLSVSRALDIPAGEYTDQTCDYYNFPFHAPVFVSFRSTPGTYPATGSMCGIEYTISKSYTAHGTVYHGDFSDGISYFTLVLRGDRTFTFDQRISAKIELPSSRLERFSYITFNGTYTDTSFEGTGNATIYVNDLPDGVFDGAVWYKENFSIISEYGKFTAIYQPKYIFQHPLNLDVDSNDAAMFVQPEGRFPFWQDYVILTYENGIITED